MDSRSKVIVKEDSRFLALAGADIFTSAAKSAVKERGHFVVAVSGGSTPRSMHRVLAKDPYCSETPWQEISFFWVDERCIPVTEDESNYGAARSDLLERVPIPLIHIHPMPVDMPPDKGAIEYQRVLNEFFQLREGQYPSFDLIFLGIGSDGHTASLFPGQKALYEKKRWVVAVKGGDPDVDRLTLTLPLLNRARQIVILVSGKGKAAVLKALFEDKKSRLPAGKIKPLQGDLIWLIDREAATGLPKEVIDGTI